MRHVILQEFVSLDGLAAGADDSVDFVPASTNGDQSFGARQLAFMDTIDTILLGRVTYEMFSGYWPSVTSGEDQPFAERLNAIPKVVFSSTLKRAPWGDWPEARIVAKGATEEIARLRESAGRDMVIWGSLSLAQSLMDEGLVDEYQLVMCPVVLGTGRRLFRENAEPGDMALRSAETFDRGAVLLTYAPAQVAAGAGAASRRS